MKWLSRPTSAGRWGLAALWILYLVMWSGGVGSYVLRGGVRPGEEWAAPLFLTIAAALVLAPATGGHAAVLLGAGLVGFGFEWIGLQSHWLFGEYVYTDVLAPKAAGVPVVMISAWLVLAAYVHDLLRERRWPASARIIAGAALLTTIDLVIDPLAAGRLGYWEWPGGGGYYGVPAHNFAGWFAAGLVILGMLHVVAERASLSPTARPVGLSIVLFFTVAAASFGLAVPATVGVTVCALHVRLAFRLFPRRPNLPGASAGERLTDSPAAPGSTSGGSGRQSCHGGRLSAAARHPSRVVRRPLRWRGRSRNPAMNCGG